MERSIDIYFEGTLSSGDVFDWREYFDDVSSDCTDAQISAFCSVCGAIVDGDLINAQVTDIRNVEVN